MSVSPFDPSRFVKANSCLPCCTPAPAGCACALLIPPVDDFTTSPYPDHATAAAAIAAQVANCLGYVRLNPAGGFITSFTADDSIPNQLTLSVTGDPDNPPTVQAKMWASLNLKAGSTLTVVSSAAGGLYPGSGGGILYSCDGTIIDTQLGAAVTFSIPTDGEYLFAAGITSTVPGFGGGSDTLTSVISSDNAMTINPVIALWDDSGTTRQLEACPKTLIPELTESSGTWYANCAAALAAFAAKTVGCLVYDGNLPNPAYTTYAATGGSSLVITVASLSDDGSGHFGGTTSSWASINALAGAIISVAFNLSNTVCGGGPPPAMSAGVALIDAITNAVIDGDGAFTPSPGPLSGTLHVTIPYTGKFYLRINSSGDISCGLGQVDFTCTVTSDSAMSVNPIQALYDLGLTCPARLNCGDTCP